MGFELAAAGAVMGAMGAYNSAGQQKSSLNFQAGMSDINARMAEQAAQTTLSAGQRDEQNARLKTAALKGTQTANLAANGVDLGSGSATNILTTTDVMGESDALTINANTSRAALAQRTQAVNYQNDALLKRATAGSINPGMAAFSSLLGSAGSVAAKWNTPKTTAAGTAIPVA